MGDKHCGHLWLRQIVCSTGRKLRPMAGVQIFAIALKHLLAQHFVAAQQRRQAWQVSQQIGQGQCSRGVREVVASLLGYARNRAAGTQKNDGMRHEIK